MKKTLPLFASLMCLMAADATEISQSYALQKARTFMQLRGVTADLVSAETSQQKSRSQGTSAAKEAYYAFNVGRHQGFVIMAADDCAPEVLGYSDTGFFDAASLPDGLMALLQDYTDQITYMKANGLTTNKRKKVAGNAITPFLNTHWAQDTPYNNSIIISTPSQTFSSVTGCVATAMAQVMYHYKYPEQTTAAIPQYQINYGNVGIATFEEVPAGTTLDWDNMSDRYTNEYGQDLGTSDAQKKAVADLMWYCGKSVGMLYSGTSASASLSAVPKALKDYFGYYRGMHYVLRDNYVGDWDQLIYDELAAGRPVLLGGQTASNAGHAFIAHGYDGDGKFYINWGWGFADGYFLLSALEPETQGTGGTAGGYNYRQEAVIDIRKAEHFCEKVLMTTTRLSVEGSSTFTRQSQHTGFGNSSNMPNFAITVTNQTYNTYDMELNFGLYKNGELVETLLGTSVSIFEFTNTQPLTLERGSTAWFANRTGTYQIYPISRKSGSSKWLKNKGGFFITAELTETTLTLSVTQGEDDDEEGSCDCGSADCDCDGCVSVNALHYDSTCQGIVGYYDIKGQLTDSKAKGLKIVRYRDGSTKKILVK